MRIPCLSWPQPLPLTRNRVTTLFYAIRRYQNHNRTSRRAPIPPQTPPSRAPTPHSPFSTSLCIRLKPLLRANAVLCWTSFCYTRMILYSGGSHRKVKGKKRGIRILVTRRPQIKMAMKMIALIWRRAKIAPSVPCGACMAARTVKGR